MLFKCDSFEFRSNNNNDNNDNNDNNVNNDATANMDLALSSLDGVFAPARNSWQVEVESLSSSLGRRPTHTVCIRELAHTVCIREFAHTVCNQRVS